MIKWMEDELGVDKMEILQKAKELGVLISESEEMKTLKESEALVNQDEKAVSLIDEHRQIQLELIQALREGKSKEKIEEKKAKFAQKQKEINVSFFFTFFIISNNAS